MSEHQEEQQPTGPSTLDTIEGVAGGLASAGLTSMFANKNDGILEHGTEAAGAAATGYEVANSKTMFGKLEAEIEGTVLTTIAVKAEEWIEGK
jgi:hypothetical protein